jgi:hypothetical protein
MKMSALRKAECSPVVFATPRVPMAIDSGRIERLVFKATVCSRAGYRVHRLGSSLPNVMRAKTAATALLASRQLQGIELIRDRSVPSVEAAMLSEFVADAHKALAKQAEQRYQSRHRLTQVWLSCPHCFRGPDKPGAVAARA